MTEQFRNGKIGRAGASLLLLIGVCTAAAPSFAAGPAGLARQLDGAVSQIIEGNRSIAPFAHVLFCVKNADQCLDTGGAEIAVLDRRSRAELKRVNAAVNRAIRPTSDADDRDVWSVDVTKGDCEDYALTKRKRLIDMGWSSKALRIAIARTAWGEGHAVLVVKTDMGDLVLDNRTNAIKPWRAAGLTWLKIQSGENPRIWFDVNRQDNAPMALVSGDRSPATADIDRMPPRPR